ncbi:SusC/RagA family TonB-linked outer membrane protein [Draconibacterium sediminis]|uniref:TonB-dependent receptor plug domain-containing protein n=1 Tax=Draconibacterium sediminis TaxID=1544798 RepID=A0A0D8JFL7_9BACT|nr:SusC/RagA family TonB-linked outer membrane protein [Draconibacterium sediminis]KJF45346.1 hypothetical protein LH29_08210 [Draconibacterium sediminis]
MKKNSKITYQLSMIMIFAILFTNPVFAQKGKGKRAKKAIIEVASVLTNEAGMPIKDALVVANEGANQIYTDEKGAFSLKVSEGSVLLIEAFGYETKMINVNTGEVVPSQISLAVAPVYMGQKDRVTLPMEVQEYRRNIVGAVTTIQGAQLESQLEPELSNTLQGQGMGLIARTNTGGMANNPASLFLRGLHRDGQNEAITVVDGIERPIDDLMAEEIETIELLKDATAKILYGPRAANGVIYVTTKKGTSHKKEINVSLDYGIGTPSRMPEFLDSYNYAVLYNEARKNDGLVPYYTDADIQGYQNSKGPNDLLYPNVDAYNYYLRDNVNYTKATTEFMGGNDASQYAVVLGYLGYSGLQDVGAQPAKNRFNIRGNLNVKITDAVSAFMGVAGRIDYWKTGGINHAETFSRLSTHRPNEYPVFIEHEDAPVSKKFPTLGGSFDRAGNIYGALAFGDTHENYLNGQVNFGMKFNLDELTKGLTAKTFITFDNYFTGTRVLNQEAPTYAQRWITGPSGQDSLIFVKTQTENRNTDYTLSTSSNIRNSGINGQFNYNRAFGGHSLNADLGLMYFNKQVPGYDQDITNSNSFLRANYSYSNKYIAELDLALMGSNRFVEGNRTQMAYAIGAAWIMSEETFMEQSDVVDFLKLKASWGVLGYDAATSHFLYENRWYNNGNVSFAERNTNGLTRTTLDLIGNPDLGWEKSRELNIGVEAILLQNKLSFTMNYFNELRYDIIQKVSAEHSAIFGGLFPYYNWGKVKNSGIEAEIQWTERKGDFEYSLGANMIYVKNELVKGNEVEYPDQYRSTIGLPTDAIMGYQSLGIYGKDVALAGAPQQTFGKYGIGSLAYADLNGDMVIDDRDRSQIGNNFPRTSLGVDVDLKYKGWGLYVLGTSELGVDAWMDNAYFRNAGNGKYSVLALDRYHPVNNPEGVSPALTTTQADNDFAGSDFWLVNSSFFRLKNIELSYTFTFKEPTAVAKNIKVYTRGNNLLVLSKMKDLDPEAMNSGVNNYPVMTTVAAGVSVSF